MAFIDDDKIEEVRRVLAVQARPAFIFRDRLVRREVDFAALDGFTMTDPMKRIAKRREILGHGIVYKDVAIGQVKDFRPAEIAGHVPPGRPEFPADLKGSRCLSRTGGHGEQDAPPFPWMIASTARLIAISW